MTAMPEIICQQCGKRFTAAARRAAEEKHFAPVIEAHKK